MGEFGANTAGMQNAAVAMNETTRLLWDELVDQAADLKGLLAMWEGEAQIAYEAEKTRWETSALNMSKTLEGAGHVVDHASENYRLAEDRNRNAWM